MTTTFAPRPTIDETRPYRFPSPTTHALGNGMRVEHYPHHGRLITFWLVTRAGALQEPAGGEGVCTLTTALRMEGTARHPGEQFAAELDLLGARYTTHVNEGICAIGLDVPATNAAQALELLAETASDAVFPDDDVERVRAKLIDQADANRNTPATRAGQALRQVCFTADERAALPLAGTTTSLRSLTRTQVAGFARNALTPARTTLLVGGAVNDDILHTAAAQFGAWSVTAPPSPPATPTLSAAPRILLVHRPGSVQSDIRLGAVCDGRRAASYPALRIATHVLGGSMNSRLSAVLREEKGYTYGVQADIQPLPDSGLLVVSTSVDSPSTEAALTDLLAIVRNVCEEGVTEPERDRAVDELLLRAPLDYQAAGAVVSERAGQLTDDLPSDWLNEHRSGLCRTSAQAASTAVADTLDVRAPYLAIVGDADHVLPALNRLFPTTPISVEEL